MTGFYSRILEDVFPNSKFLPTSIFVSTCTRPVGVSMYQYMVGLLLELKENRHSRSPCKIPRQSAQVFTISFGGRRHPTCKLLHSEGDVAPVRADEVRPRDDRPVLRGHIRTQQLALHALLRGGQLAVAASCLLLLLEVLQLPILVLFSSMPSPLSSYRRAPGTFRVVLGPICVSRMILSTCRGSASYTTPFPGTHGRSLLSILASRTCPGSPLRSWVFTCSFPRRTQSIHNKSSADPEVAKSSPCTKHQRSLAAR